MVAMAVPRALVCALALLLCTSAATALDVQVGWDRSTLTVNFKTLPSVLESLSNVTVFDGSISILNTVCNTYSYAQLTSFFGNIREIRGFLSVALSDAPSWDCVSDLGFFANLRVIRGLTAYTDTATDVALYINPADMAPSHLGLSRLQMVGKYGINIQGLRPNSAIMCGKGRVDDAGFEGVNLTALLPGTASRVGTSPVKFEVTNGDDVATVEYNQDPPANGDFCPSPFCHASCNGVCWGPDAGDCQVVCSQDCGTAGCFDTSPGTCCPAECFGGCTDDNGVTLCHACADGYLITSNGTCVLDMGNSSCPTGSYPAGLFIEQVEGCDDDRAITRTVSHFYCNDNCEANQHDPLALEDGVCVDVCASGREPNATTNECIPLAEGEIAYKPCRSVFNVVDRCTLRYLEDEDCDTLLGSIIAVKDSSPNALAYATEAELQVLSRIRRILGSVQLTFAPFTSLNVLRSVEYIEARDGARPSGVDFGLVLVLSPLLRTAPLASLRYVPSVSFSGNPNLCFYYSTIDWEELGVTSVSPDPVPAATFGFTFNPLSYTDDFVTTHDSFPKEHPACDSTCHPLCRPDRCWGPDIDDCQRCPNNTLLHEGACLAVGETCPDGFYSNTWSCRPCHSDCAACTGPTASECAACEGALYLKDSRCVPGCGDNFFANATTNACESCHTQCMQCFGPASDECAECVAGFSLRPWNNTCTPVGTCPTGYFSDTATKTCTACPSNCIACTANTANAVPPILCLQADDGYYVTGGQVFAVDTCMPGMEYEQMAPTPTSNRACAPITQCVVGREYIYENATSVSDQVCANCTECDPVTQVRRQGAGSCDGVVDSVCDFINVCLLDGCMNGGNCTSYNGTTRVCSCTSGFCGDSCQFVMGSDGVCGATTAQSSTEQLFTAVGGAAGGLVLLVVLVVVTLRVRERIYGEIYKPDDKFRAQHAPTDAWEIERDLLTVGRVIGEGQFGKVSRGLLVKSRDPYDETPAQDVAVKQLKGNANGTQEEDEFFKEMDLMKSLGRHRHVLSLVGVCTLDDPILLLTEFSEHGDLRSYLRSHRPSLTQPESIFEEDKIDFGAQIASGMLFLADNKIVHRDLAARNILVSSGTVLKVSDFGLARDVAGEDMYEKKSAGKIAFKWMAPECINDRIFTTMSDVWSFGITLWEIATLARPPYPEMNNYEVVQALKTGYRMPPPDECSDDLYDIMRRCWVDSPERRPLFKDLLEELAGLAGKSTAAYLDDAAGEKPTKLADGVIERLKEDPDRPYLIPTLQRDQLPELSKHQVDLATLAEEDEDDDGLGYVEGKVATNFEEPEEQEVKETRLR